MDTRCDDFVVGIFQTNLRISDVFLSDQNSILLFYITVIFIHFYNVFALKFDSPKISSVLMPSAVSHILLEYNNENMRFILLLLTNQIAYIFRSDEEMISIRN